MSAELVALLNRARANGDPEKYSAMVSVAQAHRIATALSSQAAEIAEMRMALTAAKRLTEPHLSPFHKMALTNMRAIARTIDAALTRKEG